MAFCSHGLQAAKDMLHKLTPALEKIIDTVLNVTGTIMKGAAWPEIEAIIQTLPGGKVIEDMVIAGLNQLTNVKAILDETDWKKKLQLFIEDIKNLGVFGQHANLIKLASILTAALHANAIATGLSEQVHTESTYDSLTQVKVVAMNAEAKAAA